MKQFFAVGLLLLLLSCSGGQHEFSSMEEAQAYANDNDNGYIQSNEAGDHIFSAKVNPAVAGSESVSVNLRISRIDGRPVLEHQELSPEEVAEKELYLSFEFAQDVYLICNGKEIRPLLHHYERNYKLKPALDILLTFPVFQPTDDVRLMVRDQLFGSGLQELVFDRIAFEPIILKH